MKTNLSETAFETKYKEMVDHMYYNENKLNNIIQILKDNKKSKVDDSYFYMKDTKIGLNVLIEVNGKIEEIT